MADLGGHVHHDPVEGVALGVCQHDPLLPGLAQRRQPRWPLLRQHGPVPSVDEAGHSAGQPFVTFAHGQGSRGRCGGSGRGERSVQVPAFAPVPHRGDGLEHAAPGGDVHLEHLAAALPGWGVEHEGDLLVDDGHGVEFAGGRVERVRRRGVQRQLHADLAHCVRHVLAGLEVGDDEAAVREPHDAVKGAGHLEVRQGDDLLDVLGEDLDAGCADRLGVGSDVGVPRRWDHRVEAEVVLFGEGVQGGADGGPGHRPGVVLGVLHDLVQRLGVRWVRGRNGQQQVLALGEADAAHAQHPLGQPERVADTLGERRGPGVPGRLAGLGVGDEVAAPAVPGRLNLGWRVNDGHGVAPSGCEW